MEREERECHEVENWRRAQYEKDYGHPEGPVRNPARQPRSEVMAVVQDDDVAQVGDSGDDMALTAFSALAPHLCSVAYPDNFKPNIQKYDGRSDHNIWLLTYYVAVKAASGNFDQMASYFPLVMGDAPSLWLNNLLAGSITSWADLSQAFTSNFQVTYNRPGNAFNLGRVTMKPGERLRDYTNWFFENRNTGVGVRDDQVVDNYKKGLRDCKVFEKILKSSATTVTPLMEVINKLIDTEETLVNQFDHDDKQDAGTSGTAGDAGSKFHKRSLEVLVADGRQPSTFNVEEFNAVLDGPYTFHEGGTHTVRECQQFKRAFHAPEDPKRPRGDGDRSSSHHYSNNRRDDRRGRQHNERHDDRRRDNNPPEDHREECDLPPPSETGNPNGPFQHAKRSINMIVGGLKSSTSRRRYRKDNREVQLMHTKPSQPLCWLEQPITFSRANH
jgi:hypothetical protein